MDFQSEEITILRTGMVNLPQLFVFYPCSSETVNDGSLPANTTIVSATSQLFSSASVDITSAVVVSTTIENRLNVRVLFNYSGTPAKGKCKLLLSLTLNTGAVIVKRWDELTIE